MRAGDAFNLVLGQEYMIWKGEKDFETTYSFIIKSHHRIPDSDLSFDKDTAEFRIQIVQFIF